MIDRRFLEAAARQVFHLIVSNPRSPSEDDIARVIEEAWLDVPQSERVQKFRRRIRGEC